MLKDEAVIFKAAQVTILAPLLLFLYLDLLARVTWFRTVIRVFLKFQNNAITEYAVGGKGSPNQNYIIDSNCRSTIACFWPSSHLFHIGDGYQQWKTFARFLCRTGIHFFFMSISMILKQNQRNTTSPLLPHTVQVPF